MIFYCTYSFADKHAIHSRTIALYKTTLSWASKDFKVNKWHTEEYFNLYHIRTAQT